MKLRGEVSTSMVPPHRFLTFLKPLLRSGLDLLFLSASSGLSSSYQSACMAAEQLRELINAFGLDAKVVERKEHYIVYLKEGEQIVDLLNIMEAPLALMDLENVRIVKEMRNDINRKVNCETANLNKVVGAAVKQLEDINYIEETIGLARLPEQLAEVARVRLEYPDRSLKELGSFLMTPVGKSGVNHRLRKISSIAEALREGKGGIE